MSEELEKREFDKKWKCFLDFEKQKYDCSEIIVRGRPYNDILLKHNSQGVWGYLQINITETAWSKLNRVAEPRHAKTGISRIE